MILNVNQDEYISEGDDAAGMRLVIHQAQRMPFPEDEGLAINPGQTTSIGLRRVTNTAHLHSLDSLEVGTPLKSNTSFISFSTQHFLMTHFLWYVVQHPQNFPK